MSDLCTIHFPGTKFPSITLALQENLSEHLTIQNSPVLFGCRTGICGTCLVEITGKIPPPKPEELELLDTLAPHHAHARLACQIELTADLEIRKLEG
ncbi:2Fe-2S ferredoxin-type domain-containing protein [Tumidithrix helvetica PCC 7403]|uniref:2Fe-2S iron-sulfur cluster binding domain-containing protein n=1 Tax=Tumidithrix helvetica TaxID=3457545 RepID=UPI003CA7B5A5